MIKAVRGFTPTLGPNVFVAETACLIGDVRLGKNSSVWFNVVLRGDVMPILIGEDSNIQDNAVVHGSFDKCGAVIGDRVTVGHAVILHGCEIGDEVLIGMGSIIMDQAKIPARSIVGAGSLVTENQTFPPGHLIMGRPARAVRPLKPEEFAFLVKSANNYVQYQSWYAGKDSKP